MKSLFFLSLFSLAACQSPAGNGTAQKNDSIPATATATTAKVNDTTSLGGIWYLQPVLPSDTAAGHIPTISFDTTKTRFSGFTGCNTMHGAFYFSGTDSSLSFGDNIATSRMTCPGFNEPAFLKSLKNTTRYRLSMGTLILLAQDNSELSRWMRKPAKATPLKA